MIRPATLDDLHLLLPLARAEFDDCLAEGGFEWDEEEMRWSLLNFATHPGDRTLLVAVVGGAIVGYIGGVITPWMHNRHQSIAIEAGWYVLPKHRGTPVAIRLWRAWEKWVQVHDASLIYCASPKTDPTVGKMLERMDYKMLETYYVKEV